MKLGQVEVIQAESRRKILINTMNVTKSQFFWGILFLTNIISLNLSHSTGETWINAIFALVAGVMFALSSARAEI